MNRLRAVLQLLENGVNALMQRVAFVALVALLVVISLQIVFRVFFQALTWSEEVARYLLVWITFIGASIAYKHGRHIAVTFVVDALPGGLARLVRAGAIAAAMVFFAVIVVSGYKYMMLQSMQVSASLRLSMGIVYAIIPFSMATMFVYALADFCDLFLESERS